MLLPKRTKFRRLHRGRFKGIATKSNTVVFGDFGIQALEPITERAAESRMGSGKGTVSYWVATIKPGHILFEITGLEREAAFKVLKTASYKLPIKTKIVTREISG